MKRAIAIFLALGWFCLGSLTQTLAQNGGIATWSVQTNTSAWNKALGVTYTRQGCPDAPANCVSFVKSVSTANNVKVTLAIPLNTSTTASYATQYSQLSQTAPFLIEVSIDDFVDQYRALFTGSNQPAALVAEVIANLKSANPKLKFGATIYEDDLVSPYLQNAKLPAAVRNGFDYIHLFLHYREDGPNFAGYVQQAKVLFPKARIVAGAYAYDHRAFLPCTPKGVACTEQQDSSLFEQSLTIQTQEMKQGIVDHIEFFPGYFGNEAQWSWNDPRHCAPGEVTECIANTVAMREAALNILSSTTPSPIWSELAPSGPLPVARYAQSAAIDSVNHRMIVFGGFSATKSLNDTWILTNADGQRGQPAWIPLPASNAPPATYYSNGMYDPGTNRMIVFGGNSGTEVWVLTNANGLASGGSAWIQLSPAGAPPAPLNGWETQVYDPARNVMIVYDSSAGVWVLSHANGTGGTPVWSQNAPAGGPSIRAGFTAVYNPTHNRMIVFGGSDGSTNFNDLWVLVNANGIGGAQAWHRLATGTATLPAGREGHSAVYDAANDAMTIFGGIGMPAESWTVAHASGLTQAPVWTLANPGVAGLDPRSSCTAVLDTESLSMIVFGGYNIGYFNSTFVLSPVL